MSKKLKTILSMLLVFAIIIVPLVALGDNLPLSTSSISTDVDLMQEGSFDKDIIESDVDPSTMYSKRASLFSHFTADIESVEDIIYNMLLNHEIEIYVYNYNISINDIEVIYATIINNHPDLFFVSSSLMYTYNDANDTTYKLYPEYAFDIEETEEAQQIFEAGVQDALSYINDSMTDVQKALVLHDYICNKATYPFIGAWNDELQMFDFDESWYHSAYGLFYDGNIVCAGYTLLYSYLLERIGIETEYVVCDDMVHAWNKIKIDGKWYNVDLTYDDLNAYNNESNVYGGFLHRCFLKSDDAIMDEIGMYHYGDPVCVNDVEATDTSYDNYFWNNVDTNIYVIDNEYYYLGVVSGSLYLMKRDANGAATKLDTTTIPNNAIGLTVGEDEDELHITDRSSRLVYLNGKFFVNTIVTINKVNYECVACISNVTGEWQRTVLLTLPKPSNMIIGLGIDDQANVVYQTMEGSFNETSIPKIDYFNDSMLKEEYVLYADTNNDNIINAKDYAMIINAER